MGVNFSRSRESAPHCPGAEEGLNSGAMEREEGEEEFQEAEEHPSPAQELEEFKKQLAVKREQRRSIIAKHAAEKENLRRSLLTQVQVNEKISNENRLLRELLELHGVPPPTERDVPADSENPLSFLVTDLESIKEHNRKLHVDLAETNLSLQSANEEMMNLQSQNVECMKQINALKEVVAVSKTMMQIRESQLNELKGKLSQIESSLAEREAHLLSSDLRAEYERQLSNIRALRTLYEERARLAETTRAQLVRELEEQRVLTAVETSRCKELTDKVAELEVRIAELSDLVDSRDDQISQNKEESRALKAEMSTVNKLFSQMLLGYRSQQDLDKLVARLEEHHGLLAHMVARDGEASSALPRLLLDLVGQLDHDKTDEEKLEEESTLNTTAAEIVDNLPKVWRVLMELLSHQSVSNNENSPEQLHPTTCYKPVETSAGTRMVPSVSQTYIRLKDLIVEKLSLTKEMNKMKQLNVHLESRLEEQEKRLNLVTSELSKTWHVVGRLRRHHHQLHTHEKILRYELQQKRKMLNELKEELEYCKEKWDKAREKNCESEKEWHKLRNEFSSRKNKIAISLNSGESGYSDERQTEDDSTESNDESECVNDQQIRLKKRLKKAFELLGDSSTDRNLAAEREDPISDSLDIADLPLDGFDVDEKDADLSTSESCISDSCDKSFSIDDNNGQMLPSTSENNVTSRLSASNEILPHKSPISVQSYAVQPDLMTANCENISSTESDHKLIVNNISFDESTNLEQNLQNDTEFLKKVSETGVDYETVESVSPGTSTANNFRESVQSVNACEGIKLLDPQKILENVRKQNERLGKRDERMKNLEKGCESLVCISKNTLVLGSDIEKRLDNVIERLSHETPYSEIENESVKTLDHSLRTNVDACSSTVIDLKENISESEKPENHECSTNLDGDEAKILEQNHDNENNLADRSIFEQEVSILQNTALLPGDDENSSNLIDPKNILENVRKQNERLAERDKRMKKLEEGCHTLLDISNNTLQVGSDLEKRLDNLVERKSNEIAETKAIGTELASGVKKELNNCDGSMTEVPSTSSTPLDHEARFAARDERFKRLEELTKSLVSKVNNTTNKSVRLTYKLEELHNIYGSESGNSRNETPEQEQSDNETSPETNGDT